MRDGKTTFFEVNVKRIMRSENAENFQVNSGDLIFVKEIFI